MAKHFKSHWKELLEEQRQQAQAAKSQAEAGTADEAALGTGGSAAQADVAEPDEETGVWKERWHTARLTFHRYRYAWLGASLAVFAVCLLAMHGPNNRPKLVRVSGHVLIDGKPLPGGTILFVPDGGRPSAGELDQNGRFTLTCFGGNDGAIVGLQRIAITPSGVPGEDDPPWPVPLRYADHSTSGLLREITEPTSDLVVELTTDGAPTANEVGDVPPGVLRDE